MAQRKPPKKLIKSLAKLIVKEKIREQSESSRVFERKMQIVSAKKRYMTSEHSRLCTGMEKEYNASRGDARDALKSDWVALHKKLSSKDQEEHVG